MRPWGCVAPHFQAAAAAAAPADVFLKTNKKIGNAQRAKGGTKNNIDGWAAVAAARWVVRPLGLRRTPRGAALTLPHQSHGGAWQPQGLVWVGT